MVDSAGVHIFLHEEYFVEVRANKINSEPKRVLCLLFPGFEEIETVAPVDLLRRAGAQVVVASLTSERLVAGRCQIRLQADALLPEVIDDDFDLLIIPGGPGIKMVREDGRAAALAQKYNQLGKLVAAICAAPMVLADAGLLESRRFTSHFGVTADLPATRLLDRVVDDQNIVTSQGAATSIDFGLALVRRLCGEAIAAEVARGIMAN